MIRLILLPLAVFLSWVLFVSEFDKRKKIIISVVALVVTIFAMWFEQSGQVPKDDLLTVQDIVDCGVQAEHSYRTNYDVEFCLTNTGARATATRINVDFLALSCEEGDCTEIQAVNREVRLSLAPGESATMSENLDFNQLSEANENHVWSIRVVSVKALP